MIIKDIEYCKIKIDILEDFLKSLLASLNSIAINIKFIVIDFIISIISDSRYNINLILDFRICLFTIYRKVSDIFFRPLEAESD